MKEIPNFPNYMATEDGRIWSKKNNKFLSLKSESKGYQKCNLYDASGKVKNVRVHRIIWITFNGEIPSGYEINHKNEVRNDNRLENLELLTHQANLRYGNGPEKRRLKQIELVKRGGDCNFAKPITLIDEETGEELSFKSKIEAAKHFDIIPWKFTYIRKCAKINNTNTIKIYNKTFKMVE